MTLGQGKSIRPVPARRFGLLFGAALLAAPAPSFAQAQAAHVTILSTTDLHGHIYPLDYFTGMPFPGGLARIATAVEALRREDPNLLLVDSGDTIEGTPLEYYHARRDNVPPDPMMLAMDSLRYDAMTIGNHEFDFGLDVLEKARREARFPWLSANIYRTATGQPAYTPYIVKVVNGVRIGILGLTTPGIPYWEDPKDYQGLEFRDPLPEARKWVAVLRHDEHVDAVVVAMHMGLERNLATGTASLSNVPNENRAIAIAEGVPGIDLILMGHTHVEVPALVINGVLLAQADLWGERLVRADLDFSRDGSGPWRLVAKGTQSLPMSRVEPDPAVLALARPCQEETERWLTQPIGTCGRTIDERAIFSDSALLDLVQRVQLEAGGADVSLASVFNPQARIAAGPVTVRELAALYGYDNTLVVLRATGAQLKEALEFSARFFLPYQPGRTLNQLVNPAVFGFNFDKAAGVTYEIDVRRPYGERIRHLAFHGRPLDPGQTIRLALNNYRAAGGGGYRMFQGDPVLFRSAIQIRDLIIDWVEKHRSVPTEPLGNWRIVGGASAPDGNGAGR